MKPTASPAPAAIARRIVRPVTGALRRKPAAAPKTAHPTLADAAKLLRGLDHPEFMPHGRPHDKESKRIPL